MKTACLLALISVFFVQSCSFGEAAEPAAGEVPGFSPSVSPGQVSDDYIIGEGDELEVLVWRNEQLSRRLVVMPDGKISLPLIQQVRAAGRTIASVRQQIASELSPYVENPKVTVIVTQLNSFRVSVLGRVVKPGVYPITGKTTVIEAISMAGGLTEWAKKSKIQVIRNYGSNEVKIRVDYNKIVSGKDLSQNIVLGRGDTVIVP